MQPKSTVIYEQPANELVRTCLRLEGLFATFKLNMAVTEAPSIKMACEALLEIVTLLDRNDLKATFAKEIAKYFEMLIGFKQKQGIDEQKLESVLKELQYLTLTLNEGTSKFGEELRQNEFLSALRLYANNPGGLCYYDSANFYYWLSHPDQLLVRSLQNWLESLQDVRRACKILLHLLRESFAFKADVAPQGMTQILLDPKLPCQLVRIAVSHQEKVYPEISIGKHRIVIRFLEPSLEKKPQQISHDIHFKIACCAL